MQSLNGQSTNDIHYSKKTKNWRWIRLQHYGDHYSDFWVSNCILRSSKPRQPCIRNPCSFARCNKQIKHRWGDIASIDADDLHSFGKAAKMFLKDAPSCTLWCESFRIKMSDKQAEKKLIKPHWLECHADQW